MSGSSEQEKCSGICCLTGKRLDVAGQRGGDGLVANGSDSCQEVLSVCVRATAKRT